MSSIFLSHSHADKPFARKLAAALRGAGHDVWIDEAEINIGDSLIAKIREGLDKVDYVAAVLSAASIASPWVTRELDIASNREIDEKRVVVLPLLVEQVEMPGFLKGKFFGDFRDPSSFDEPLALLLRALGPARAMPQVSAEELAFLRTEVKAAVALARQHESAVKAHETLAMRNKSPSLVAAIAAANKKHPLHAPINATYAFEASDMPVTLDYLFWAMAKAEQRGSHPLDLLISKDGKWGAVKAMLEAYKDLLGVAEPAKG